MRTIKLIALFSLFAVGYLAKPAHAATISCTVSRVTYLSLTNNNLGVPTSSKQFWIGCADGTQYYENAGNPTSSACPQVDGDTLKTYLSIAESAKLSGKTLTIGYNANQTCQLPPNVGNGSSGTNGTFTTNVINYLQFDGI